ncbi:MAG TPA: hypothetical protein VET30_11410 [Pseudoxanthomonas sp.]|nr:hypothetical protein [Pseudoxanthomonas sp.]
MILRPLALACLVLVLAACKPSTPASLAAGTTPATALEKTAEALNPLSSAKDEVSTSFDRMLAARSYHATITTDGQGPMTTEMDFVAPDRFRMQMAAGTQVIIGDTLYMQAGGRSLKTPLPKGSMTQSRDPLKIEQNKASLEVESLGSEDVDGQSSKKYRVRHAGPPPSDFTYWIGDNGLPVQLQQQGQAQGKPYTMTLRYSRFNDPAITIDAPQ